MDKKPVYVLCPRCELNYFIANKTQKYCTICLAEMNKADPEMLIPEEDDNELETLCPVCKVNYMTSDEEMCFMCSKEHSEKAPAESHPEGWEDFVEEEPVVEEEPIEISLTELEEAETLVEDEDDIFEDEENIDEEELFDDDDDEDDEDFEEEAEELI